MSAPHLPAEARRASVDRLDSAIDQVAARIVQVRDDEELALRIAGALPGRSSRFRWLLPQLAAVAAFAIAAVVWTTRDTATPSLLTAVVAVMAVPNSVAAVPPGTASRAKPSEPVEPVKPLDSLPREGDFDRSLAPIEAMNALVVSDLEAQDLPAASPLVLPPIAITDLPLTAESFSPR